jgi:HAD superfamily hydrolase (TIGR01549 family)
MKIDGIGFDYGNTLVLDPFEKVMQHKGFDFVRILEKNGYEVAKKKFVDAWSGVNRNLNYPHCSHFAQEIPLVRAALEALGVKKTDRYRISQQLLVAYRSGLKYLLRNDTRIEGVRAVLEELMKRHKKLLILSNERIDTINSQLHWTGLARFFDRVVVSQRLGIEKPDPRIFKYMVRLFDLPKERILYVGDDPGRDIRPAKEIGIKAALFEQPKEMSAAAWRDYSFELKENEKPDFVIKDLGELLQIVE